MRQFVARHTEASVTQLLNADHSPEAINDACMLRWNPADWMDAGLEIRRLKADAWRALRTAFRDPQVWRDVFGARRLVDLVQNGQDLDEWEYTTETLGTLGYLEPAKVLEATDWVLRPPAGVSIAATTQLAELIAGLAQPWFPETRLA